MSKVIVLSDFQHQMLNALLLNVLLKQEISELAHGMEMAHTREFNTEFRKMQQLVENHETPVVLIDFVKEELKGLFSNKAEAQKYVESFKSEDHGDNWVHDVMHHADESWDVQEVKTL